jgi:DtxR family Mn-dependent transcriptional regulator
MGHALSTAEQDYLKHVYALQEETGRATTQALAARVGVKPSSATAMIKRLAEDDGGPYVRHMPYHGVELTPRGVAAALEIVRHHRLLELFLATQLDMPWDRVHAEAERLEHAISEDLEERIAATLGQPTRDPHGDPIPGRDGTVDPPVGVPLDALPLGAEATVVRVPDGDSALLRYLDALGLVPGARLMLEEVAPYGDTLTVRVGEGGRVIGRAVARRITVDPAALAWAGGPR